MDKSSYNINNEMSMEISKVENIYMYLKFHIFFWWHNIMSCSYSQKFTWTFILIFQFLLSIGQYKVGVSQLMKAPEGMLARKVSDDGIGAIKTVLRDNQPRQLPVIPVMATGRWNGNVSSQDKFIVLAGYPLYMAAKDLSTDGK